MRCDLCGVSGVVTSTAIRDGRNDVVDGSQQGMGTVIIRVIEDRIYKLHLGGVL